MQQKKISQKCDELMKYIVVYGTFLCYIIDIDTIVQKSAQMKEWLDKRDFVSAIFSLCHSKLSDAVRSFSISLGGVKTENDSLGSLSFFLAPFLRS